MINHFYHVEAMDLTWPEFMGALEKIGAIVEELRPKTREEITAAMGKEASERFAEAKRLRQQAQEN